VDIPQIDVASLARAHAAGATVLDVRNPDEYEAGHVPGAVLIPLPELAERVDEVPTGAPLYVICAMGGRSQKAAEHLAAGGRDVANVAGGTTAWIEAGFDVTSGSQP
jgi:rhodanese-related sulfurtransferase